MPGAHAFEQVIAANLDQVVPVFAAAEPEPHWNMLDRYLVTAESLDLPALIRGRRSVRPLRRACRSARPPLAAGRGPTSPRPGRTRG